jgi:SAM-dependent methyltransferase
VADVPDADSPTSLRSRSEPPAGISQAAPNAARVYDWLLGGKDNYDADRQAARRLLRAVPGARQAARDNRAFLARAVAVLAEQGITQFIDIGSGLPAAGPVHEIARETRPDARVAYVDHDPVVVAHARALLADAPGLVAVQADLRDPGTLLADPALAGLIDFGQPVAVLLVAVLHFLKDADDPHGIVRAITARLAPGSYLAISHGTTDEVDVGAARAAQTAYQGASMPGVPRSRAEVERFFDGLDLLPPGVADVRSWGQPGAAPSGPVLFWGAVGRLGDAS